MLSIFDSRFCSATRVAPGQLGGVPAASGCLGARRAALFWLLRGRQGCSVIRHHEQLKSVACPRSHLPLHVAFAKPSHLVRQPRRLAVLSSLKTVETKLAKS